MSAAAPAIPTVSPAVFSAAKHDGHVNMSPWTRTLTDADLPKAYDNVCHIVRQGVVVTKLSVDGAEAVAPWTVVRLSQAMGASLREISLVNCRRLTDAGLETLGSSCRELRHIRLDGCPLITATGFSGLMDHCKELESLSVDGCASFDDACVIRVSAAGDKLRAMSMAGCARITDLALAALGDTCHELRDLDISAGPAYTDSGLISLARGVPQLRRLVLKNPKLSYRITDDFLSLAAEKCPLLEHLDLTGCDAITDVGVRWLAASCKGMQTLYLTGCRYIGDRGMLSIGNALHELRRLSIASCRLVSDIGIRHLADGCPLLEHVDLSNLILLTDGRLKPLPVSARLCEAPAQAHLFRSLTFEKKAMAREIMLDASEIGVPSLAHACHKITHLTIAHADNLGTSTARRLSHGCAGSLRVLVLTHCRFMTSADLSVLVAGSSRSLRHLDLRGSTCVDQASMRALGASCRWLEMLNISGCPRLTDDSFKYIMLGCTNLTHLYMNDNPQLTDIACYHLSITAGRKKLAPAITLSSSDADADDGHDAVTLSIAGAAATGGAGTHPTAYASMRSGPMKTCNLRVLHMRDCKLLSDSGLCWILEQHPNIYELNVMGTGVSRGSLVATLKGTEDSRGPCVVRDDDFWFGFFPKYRADDILRENEYREQFQHSIKIQAAWRGYVARARVRKMREAAIDEWLATKLQSLWRGYKARELAVVIRHSQTFRMRAVILITAAYRRFRLRRAMRAEAVRQRMEKFLKAVTQVQRYWRSQLAGLDTDKVGSLLTTNKRRKHVRYLRREAALDIQRVYRAYVARKVLPGLRLERLRRDMRRQYAAQRIMLAYRGYKDMLRLRHQFLAICAATRVCQRWWRRLRARWQRRLQWARLQRQATLLQAMWRGVIARRRAAVLRAIRLERLRQHSARVIQRAWVWYKFMRGLRRSHGVRWRMHLATIDVQRIFRGYLGRRYAKYVRDNRAAILENRALLEVWAATKIQSSWRRVLAVRAYNELRIASTTMTVAKPLYPSPYGYSAPQTWLQTAQLTATIGTDAYSTTALRRPWMEQTPAERAAAAVAATRSSTPWALPSLAGTWGAGTPAAAPSSVLYGSGSTSFGGAVGAAAATNSRPGTGGFPAAGARQASATTPLSGSLTSATARGGAGTSTAAGDSGSFVLPHLSTGSSTPAAAAASSYDPAAAGAAWGGAPAAATTGAASAGGGFMLSAVEREMMKQGYALHLDADSGSFFLFNATTGESHWVGA